MQGVRKNKGGGRKRTANEAELDEEPANQGARQELVRLEDIEMVYSKRRKDKEAKMEAILKGKIQNAEPVLRIRDVYPGSRIPKQRQKRGGILSYLFL